MAIVEYKCNTCNRTIEKPRNTKGLEVIGRCSITKGCRGNLYQTRVLQDFQRGTIPAQVDGLENWIQRPLLFNHSQIIKQEVWTIEHNMGVIPFVSAFVDSEDDIDQQRVEVLPNDIIVVNDNIIRLSFPTPVSGVAQLVGRQSDPDILTPKKQVVSETDNDIQISYNEFVVIATQDDLSPGSGNNTSLETLFITQTGKTIENGYNLVLQPTTSPWSDVTKIVLFGKIYNVYAFKGTTTDMTDNIVGNGSTFKFTEVNRNGIVSSINEKEYLMLLANDPFDTADKDYSKCVDVTNVTDTVNPFGFYYADGKLYAKESVARTTYPRIRSIS